MVLTESRDNDHVLKSGTVSIRLFFSFRLSQQSLDVISYERAWNDNPGRVNLACGVRAVTTHLCVRF